MNNKILLPILLSSLCGCASQDIFPPQIPENGTGSSSSEQIQISKKTSPLASVPCTPQSTDAVNRKNAHFDSLSGKTGYPPYANAENVKRGQYSEALNKPLSIKSSASKQKNMQQDEDVGDGETYVDSGVNSVPKRPSLPSLTPSTPLKNKRSIDFLSSVAPKLNSHQATGETVKNNTQARVYLQLGTFSNYTNAQSLQKKIADNKMPKAMVKEVKVGGKPAYRVQLGPVFSTKVGELNAKLTKMGISNTLSTTTEQQLN